MNPLKKNILKKIITGCILVKLLKSEGLKNISITFKNKLHFKESFLNL